MIPLDFAPYLAERTHDFIGREWLFAALERCLAGPAASRMFILTGEPGIGKTAIAGRLLQFSDGIAEPPAGCERLARGFVSAAHICSARNGGWIAPETFVRSMSAQLAARYPRFVQGIKLDPHIQASQQVNENRGTAINVQIANYYAESPEALFDSLVRQPLGVLCQSGNVPAQIVLLVDGLDESLQFVGRTTIAGLLSLCDDLPEAVRLVLTTRPVARILELFAPLRPYVLPVDSAENQNDVRAYAGARLHDLGAPHADWAAERLTARRQGNFLVVSKVLDAVERQELTLDDPEAWPDDLYGLYAWFLGRLIRDNIDVWRSAYRAVLGVLAITREPLTEPTIAQFTGLTDQQVRDLLIDLREFLSISDGDGRPIGYEVYHTSFVDFLADKERAGRFWIDLTEICRSKLRNLLAANSLSQDDYAQVLATFGWMRSLTGHDVDKDSQVILGELLPVITQAAAGSDADRRFAQQCRQLLVSWIDSYAAEERGQIRALVLDHLLLEVSGPGFHGACRTIAMIGFRRLDLADAMWAATHAREDDDGDLALSTLVSLGVPLTDHDRLVAYLHSRMAHRYSTSLLFTLRRLADPRSLQLLDACCQQPHPDLERLLRTIAHLAGDHPEDVETQDRAWSLIRLLLGWFPERGLLEVRLGGDIAPLCNTNRAARDLAELWNTETADAKQAAYTRYLIGLRLGECIRPRQLDGMATLHTLPEIISGLRGDACNDTSTHVISTFDQESKVNAWRTLLRLGCSEAFAWFAEGVEGETNLFTRALLMELLACFRFAPLPPTVSSLLVESYDFGSAGQSRDLALRLAAVRLARSAATPEAFDALMHFGLAHEGQALMDSLDALAEVAVSLMCAGETFVVDSLVEMAIGGVEASQRTGAGYALASLAQNDLLGDHATELVLVLLSPMLDDSRSAFERSLLAQVMGCLPAAGLDANVDGQLELLAGASNNTWLRFRALEALVRHDRLHDNVPLMTQGLGLVFANGTWDLPADTQLDDQSAFVIGLMYERHPALLEPAVVSILETRRWTCAKQLFPSVWGLPAVDQMPISDAIRAALLDLTRREQTATSAEQELFEVLARLAPDALAAESWDQQWENWLPSSRAALADALGIAAYSTTSYAAAAVSQLRLLLMDRYYAVRRAAYRALARQSPATLYALCATWAEDTVPEDLRRRAAEGCVWLHADTSAGLCKKSCADPEKTVRAAAERAQLDQQERQWAELYLSVVRSVTYENNDVLLAAWRYGDALARLGDDSCLESITSDLAVRDLLPNVRCWLRQIAQGIDKHWREVTRKWPEPWLAFHGAVVEGVGELVVSSARVYPVKYSIWRESPAPPSRPKGWGGAIWPAADGDPLYVSPTARRVELILQDGRRVDILVSSISGDYATFYGEGAYPA